MYNSIARAIAGVGCIGLGIYGYNTDIIGAGWLVVIGVILVLNLDSNNCCNRESCKEEK